MRLNAYATKSGNLRLNATNGKGRAEMLADLFTLIAINIMVAVVCYGVGYHDGHKYGRRR